MPSFAELDTQLSEGERFKLATAEERTHENFPRYVTPMGDSRERAVPCGKCGLRRATMALDALCDGCFDG